jgi:type II secretory pathway pseudopilin PulG
MRKANQRGMALLAELLVVALITVTLLAMSLPSLIQMQKSQESNSAKAKVQQFANVQIQIALCAAQTGCTPPVGLSAVAAAFPDGVSVPQGAYMFMYRNLGGGSWSFAATPGPSIFASQIQFITYANGIVSCNSGSGWAPC